jgi:DNA-directed RNA polymerase subunit RPC12/RpoP
MSKKREAICPPHKYRRRNLSKDKDKPYLVFKCMDCPHYIKTDLAVGMEARCYKCNAGFFITAKHASVIAKPTCANCVAKNNKNRAIEEQVDNILDAIMKDM